MNVGLGIGARVRRAALLLALAPWLAPAAWAQKMPPWVLDTPKDTAEAWFGVGEGPDTETARRIALRAVAAKLRTAIAGEVKNQVTDANGKVSRVSSISVSEDVLKTEFSKFSVEASAKSPVGVYLLVKVDRPAFLRDTRSQLEVLNKPILEAEVASSQASNLEQYLALRRANAQIEQALNLSLLLVGAGAEAEGRQGVARFGGLRQRAQQAATALVFEVRAKPADADVATAVAAFLADLGMRSAGVATPGASVLTIDTQSRQDELYGDKLLKLVVRLAVVDEMGRAVASRDYPLSGAARSDFRAAREAAVNKLALSLKQAGSLSALGFKE